MFKLDGLDQVALTVRDVKASVAWYRDVLGLQRIHEGVWGDVPAFVVSGTTGLALFPVRGDDPHSPPGSDTLCFRHVAFRANRAEFEKARRTLQEKGIDCAFQDHQIAPSIYFHDPDGHQIEITTYEVRRESPPS